MFQLQECPPGVSSVLRALMASDEQTFEQRLEAMLEVKGQTLQLPINAEGELLQKKSK